jgi:hypothetical protein
LGWLRDPRTREDFLRFKGISPESLISSSDEDNARALALAETIINLAKRYDAEFNKRFPQFCHERHKAQTLHKLGQDYDEDARRYVYMALAHLDAARSTFVRDAVRYAGWCLERDFGGLRAPQLVAELVSHAVGLRRKVTEHQARYLCGWIKRRRSGSA